MQGGKAGKAGAAADHPAARNEGEQSRKGLTSSKKMPNSTELISLRAARSIETDALKVVEAVSGAAVSCSWATAHDAAASKTRRAAGRIAIFFSKGEGWVSE